MSNVNIDGRSPESLQLSSRKRPRSISIDKQFIRTPGRGVNMKQDIFPFLWEYARGVDCERNLWRARAHTSLYLISTSISVRISAAPVLSWSLRSRDKAEEFHTRPDRFYSISRNVMPAWGGNNLRIASASSIFQRSFADKIRIRKDEERAERESGKSQKLRICFCRIVITQSITTVESSSNAV